MLIEIIGYLAGILSLTCIIPQILKARNSKNVQSISIPSIVLVFLMLSLWEIYGIGIHSPQLIITNAISMCLQAYWIFIVLKHRT